MAVAAAPRIAEFSPQGLANTAWGFATAGAVAKYPDASAVGADGSLVLSVRSPSSVSYTGFRVSFAAGAMSPTYSCAGGGGIPFSRGCFKADFSLPAHE